MNITSYLNSKGFIRFANNIHENQEQVNDLINLTSKSNINVLMMGFDAGHSAEFLLKNNKNLKIVSFDTGEQEYLLTAKEYIDNKYPNRHTLIIGPSNVNLELYLKYNINAKFDIILINELGSYELIEKNINNYLSLSNKDTIIVIINNNNNKIWIEYLNQNKIKQINKKQYLNNKEMIYCNFLNN